MQEQRRLIPQIKMHIEKQDTLHVGLGSPLADPFDGVPLLAELVTSTRHSEAPLSMQTLHSTATQNGN
jgi:hypothetical protein